MKSEHRHELKSNQLANWIAHFPQWSKDNARTLAITSVVLAILVAAYAWNNYNQSVLGPRNNQRLTVLMSQVDVSLNNVIRKSMEGQDTSSSLKGPAENLATFAQSVGDPGLAATAYLQRARILRAELHYRTTPQSAEAIKAQIQQAQESYNQALEKAKNNASIRAAARYGLGLCAEELGLPDDAAKLYQDLVSDTTLDGTTGQAAAEHRLTIMSNFATALTFLPAPKTENASEISANPTFNLEIPELALAKPTSDPETSDSNTGN